MVINGAECEPYLTTDHRVMVEHAADVISGIKYLLRASGAVAGDRCHRSQQTRCGRNGAGGDSGRVPTLRLKCCPSNIRKAPKKC